MAASFQWNLQHDLLRLARICRHRHCRWCLGLCGNHQQLRRLLVPAVVVHFLGYCQIPLGVDVEFDDCVHCWIGWFHLSVH